MVNNSVIGVLETKSAEHKEKAANEDLPKCFRLEYKTIKRAGGFLPRSVEQKLARYNLLRDEIRERRTNARYNVNRFMRGVNSTELPLVNTNENISLSDATPPQVGQYCCVTFAESPSKFYICADEEALAELEVTLRDMYHNTLIDKWYRTKAIAKRSLRKYCVAYVREWCRAEILDWLDDHMEDVLVFLVDMGHTVKVCYYNLREMLEYICQTPKLAMKCHLAHVWPPKGSTEWSDVAKNTFCQRDLFLINNIYWEGDSYAVELLIPETKFDMALYLIEANLAEPIGLAEPISDPFIKEQIKYALGVNKLNDFDTEDIDEIININEAILGYDPKDYTRLCQFTRLDGTCFKKHCKLEHNPLAKDILKSINTTDKDICYSFPVRNDVLDSVGEEVTLKVTCFIKVNEFYAQVVNTEGWWEFDRLNKLMNSKSVMEKYKPVTQSTVLSLAQAVAVRYDNRWYRARITDINLVDRDPDFEVFLVDYGDVCICKRNDMRLLPAEYASTPVQAVHCFLINVKEKPGVEKKETDEFFGTNVIMEEFYASVIVKEMYLGVRLRDKEQGEDLGGKLIDAGFADLETEHIQCKHRLMLVD